MPANRIRIGCSGWSYPGWKKAGFYPKGAKSGEYLRHYAEHFDTVEVDGSYYRSPSPEDCVRWAGLTPDGFTFSLKFPKGVVHGGGPRDRDLVPENIWDWRASGELAKRFVAATAELGDKRGPILLQCPYYPARIFDGWREFTDQLGEFLAHIEGPAYVLETRNGKWIEPDFVAVLRELNVSLAMADFRAPDGQDKKTFPQAGEFLSNPAAFLTGEAAYVRLIGDRYKIEEVTRTWEKVAVDRASNLQEWAEALMRVADAGRMPVYAYANNHYAGHGPETARQLISILQP